MDKLDTKDQANFADGLKGVADELDKLSKSGDKALAAASVGRCRQGDGQAARLPEAVAVGRGRIRRAGVRHRVMTGSVVGGTGPRGT